MEWVKCDLCGRDDAALFECVWTHDLELNEVICKRCTLVYLNPRMSEDEYAKFYRHQYRKLYQGSETPTPLSIRTAAKRAKHVVEFCSKHIQPQIVLDVGCGSGELLAQMRDRFGSYVMGIELSEGYRVYAEREHNLELFDGRLEDFDSEALRENPDLIILCHVLD
ncbi:class I SAM-dependent methyltransferase [Acidobacteria bacterium AH-259-L09]|nr:class I SAM-dependent methyltransferase [Acidobacteria bacterium AH-259-L09]